VTERLRGSLAPVTERQLKAEVLFAAIERSSSPS